MIKRENEEEDKVSGEVSNINELMSVTKPFTSGQYVRDILAAAKGGHIDPLAAYTVVKRFEKVAKKCIEDKEFKNLAINEAEKYLAGGAKTFEIYSAKISRGPTSTIYDFTECNHPILQELYKIQKEVETEIKKYEEELKLLIPASGFVKVDEELGISSDSKEILVDRMPFLNWVASEDQVTVKAPKKMQTIGIKFMNV